MRNFVASIPLVCLIVCSCSDQRRNELLIGRWKMVVDTVDQGPPSPFGVARGNTYEFINDSVVDTKRRYYHVDTSATRGNHHKFLGTTTMYKIVDDSIKIFDPSESIWKNGLYVKKITGDSLVLVDMSGRRYNFFRDVQKKGSTNIDAIVLSSSGCFGSCPIINIIIDSTGHVIFYGERYVDKIGFFEGQTTKEQFDRIRYEFSQAEIQTLKESYSINWTDDETISTTFVYRNQIIKSVEDYGEAGPDALYWGYSLLRYLFQDLELKQLDSTNVPVYLNLHYFRFEKGDEICDLTQAESFLLWNYLRNGVSTRVKTSYRYQLGFVRNYVWAPGYDEMEDPYKDSEEEKVKSIVTDGRSYTFDIVGHDKVTIDIGFNFFEENHRTLEFRHKGEYD